jgi:hypothetical protein
MPSCVVRLRDQHLPSSRASLVGRIVPISDAAPKVRRPAQREIMLADALTRWLSSR